MFTLGGYTLTPMLGLSSTGVFILQFSWWLPLLWAIFCKVPGHFRSQYTTIIQPQLIKRAFSVTFSYLYVRPLSGTCASSGNLKKGLHVKHYVSFIVLYRNCSSLKNCKIELDIRVHFWVMASRKWWFHWHSTDIWLSRVPPSAMLGGPALGQSDEDVDPSQSSSHPPPLIFSFLLPHPPQHKYCHPVQQQPGLGLRCD